MIRTIIAATPLFAAAGYADDDNGAGRCDGLPSASRVKFYFNQAVNQPENAGNG